MGNVKELERKRISEAAGHYLSDQPSGTLYGAYNELKNAQDEGNGSALADNYVVVWQPLTYMTVDQMVELIESSAKGDDLEDQPEFIQKMNWELLRDQKLALNNLLSTKVLNETLEGNLTGILHTLDAVQDYAVDVIGINEEIVFGKESELS